MNLLEIFSQIPSIAYFLFIAGVLLAIAEFCMPGFGICGIGSFLSFTASIIVAARSWAAGLVFSALVLLTVAIIVILFSIFASHGRFIKPLILEDKLGAQDGCQSSENLDFLNGKTGVAQTILRPAGRVKIENESYDVVTGGEFIKSGTQVRVVSVTGSRIEVREYEPDAK